MYDILVDSHKILNELKDCFCQVLNVHGAVGIRQTEMLIAKPFVPELRASDDEVAIGRLKGINCLALIRFRQKLQAGRETLCSEIHKLVNLI
jgi:hypothetical protein